MWFPCVFKCFHPFQPVSRAAHTLGVPSTQQGTQIETLDKKCMHVSIYVQLCVHRHIHEERIYRVRIHTYKIYC